MQTKQAFGLFCKDEAAQTPKQSEKHKGTGMKLKIKNTAKSQRREKYQDSIFSMYNE